MFIKLEHQKLNVYSASMQFIVECYRFTKTLPAEEKYAMASQIRRAALSVHLNIAEGSSRSSSLERKRYFEISRGSLIEVDAAFDVAEQLGYFASYQTGTMETSLLTCFRLLSALINSLSK